MCSTISGHVYVVTYVPSFFFFNLFDSHPLPRFPPLFLWIKWVQMDYKALRPKCWSCSAPRKTFTSLLETLVYRGLSLNIGALFLLSRLIYLLYWHKGFGSTKVVFKSAT